MIYKVSHRSLITYGPPVIHAQFNLRLRPVAWAGQKLLSQRLDFLPLPASVTESQGPYLVNTTQLSFADPLHELSVESEFEVRVNAATLSDNGDTVDNVRQAALQSRDLTILAPAQYLFGSQIAHLHDDIAKWAAPFLSPGQTILEAMKKLTAAIHFEFTYKPGITNSRTPPIEAFRKREGVCQDFAHIMIIALRSHGIPAGYVSGYLRTEPPPGMQRLVGADAMHAWTHVWCGPRQGWIGADPTNNCLVSCDHIAVAMGRDYADIAPINGVFLGNSSQRMNVAVDVVPVG
jgi:transglutaminase-like putative cysteine protease